MKSQSILLGTFLFVFSAFTAFYSCNGKREINNVKEGYVSFNWFEYQGTDPVYNKLSDTVNKFLNPILAGFYPDPSIVAVGEDFYLVNSSFSFYPGIPIFHSKDLVSWEQIGHVMDRPSQLELDSLGVSRGVFAPDISYHDSIFYVLNTIVDGKGNYYVTSRNPAGPWSDPVWIPIEGIDPSFFFDEDGKVYIMNNGSPEGEPLYEGHRSIWIQEFDLSAQKFIGPRKVIVNGGTDISKKPIWIEGPHIFKIKDTYYLTAAEGGTYEDHSQVVFRSKSVWGPYVPYKNNPILTQRHLDTSRINPVTCTGHADFVETQKGEWWAIFLGCRPYESNYYNTGRETFLLPVKWIDGWPVILQGNETVPYAVTRPDLTAQPKVNYPLNGNFTVRDEFNDSTLGFQYYFLRTPREDWYEITDGALNIKPRSQSINKLDQPSLVARRQQHAFCSVSTSLSYVPSNAGDKAGLVVFQNEAAYYFVGLVKSDSGLVIQLEQGTNSGPVEIMKSPIDLPESNTLFLKIEARGKYYDFFYSTTPDEWTMLKENVDATLLSTVKAGGFVGACFGMYAFSSK